MKSEDRSVAEQPPSPPNLSGRRSVLSRTYRLPREEHRCATAAQRRGNTARLINAWVAFIVACVQLLSENGKIAFVIPAEILQVAYAEDLRLYLANNLAKITLITFEQLVFPDIEQEVVVFIGEKGKEEKGIRIIEMNNLEGFARLKLEQNGFQKLQHVKEKWTKYFVTPDEMSLIQKLRNDNRFAKFSEYGLINVGITTGNNGYF